MTKKQAETLFFSVYAMAYDRPANREAWGIFTNQLCKDGEITARQYKTWCYPKGKGF